jgi:splicing factor 3B subunit 5
MAAPGERFNVNVSLSKNWEHLANKFLGTGHPDISRHELAAAQQRDALATLLGRHDMLVYAAAAEGACVARTRYAVMSRMVAPAGAPPAKAPAAALVDAVVAAAAASE